MDLSQSPLFSMLTRRLQWLGQRQQVLAQNIANSDTPGFKPRDVAGHDSDAPFVDVRIYTGSVPRNGAFAQGGR